MIDEVRLLSADEARDIVAVLDALRSAWLVRDGQTRAFATLGRAAYLDLCGGRRTVEEYRRLAADQNAHLTAGFGGLLERVRAKVEDETGNPALLTKDWALPGFHIFTGDGLQSAGAGGAHFDLQFRDLIGRAATPPKEILSFTVALELPHAGSGLRVWPIRPLQLVGTSKTRDGDEQLSQYLVRKPSVYVPYAVGNLYLQREPILHCIWNGTPIESSDRRITLQGHGLELGGELVLYW
jgi:hypothetical protein